MSFAWLLQMAHGMYFTALIIVITALVVALAYRGWCA